MTSEITKKKIECDYPNCHEESEYAPSKHMHLCQKHYEVFRFIQQSIFLMDISINPFIDRFEEMEKWNK